MKKSLKNILLGFIKLIHFYEHYKEKMNVDKNGCIYILFRIDVFFNEQFLAIKIDKQNHEDKELIFEKKKARGIKKLGCKSIKITTSHAKRGYDTDSEISQNTNIYK